MIRILKIDGGIGRVICATGAIKKLIDIEKQDEIIIITSWPEVFENNPHIFKLYKDGNIPYLFDDIIKYGYFCYPEPYHDHSYYNQKHHLIESFNHLISGIAEKIYPEIFLTQEEINFGLDVINKVKSASGKNTVIAYQAFGSGASLSQCGKISDPSFRSLNDDLNRKILDECQDYVFINLSHIPINHRNCWQQNYTLRQLFSVAFASNYIVSIDSVLSHVGVAFKKNGVLILGATYSKNVGYDEYSSYKTFQKEGYPQSYQSNRFGGHVEKNQNAMFFSIEEQNAIIESIKNLDRKPNDYSDISSNVFCDSIS